MRIYSSIDFNTLTSHEQGSLRRRFAREASYARSWQPAVICLLFHFSDGTKSSSTHILTIDILPLFGNTVDLTSVHRYLIVANNSAIDRLLFAQLRMRKINVSPKLFGILSSNQNY